jgi:hypothetical protein
VWIEGALGGGLEYQVGPINIPRHMNDTVSVRIGGEYTIDRTVTVSLGGYFENGSLPDQYLSALTIDSDKVVVGGGVGIHVSPEVSIDIAAGYIWMAPRSVRDSLVPQANPIRPPGSTTETIYIGNGDYDMTAPYFGLGLRWRGDSGNIRGPGEEEEEPAPAADEEEPAVTEEPAAPENTETEQSADPNVPWYLRGRGGAQAPAQETPAVEEPVETEETAEPEEERPRRRARRRRRR